MVCCSFGSFVFLRGFHRNLPSCAGPYNRGTSNSVVLLKSALSVRTDSQVPACTWDLSLFLIVRFARVRCRLENSSGVSPHPADFLAVLALGVQTSAMIDCQVPSGVSALG